VDVNPVLLFSLPNLRDKRGGEMVEALTQWLAQALPDANVPYQHVVPLFVEGNGASDRFHFLAPYRVQATLMFGIEAVSNQRDSDPFYENGLSSVNEDHGVATQRN
jgi:hypothetical protein